MVTNIPSEVITRLEVIAEKDQSIRRELANLEQQFGCDSQEVMLHWDRVKEIDCSNALEVTSILDQYGWLGPGSIGELASSAIFLVIQHADLVTQEKYLPMLKEAVSNNIVPKVYLAYLEDRISVRTNGFQLYGTQSFLSSEGYTLFPIINPQDLQKRREEMGLDFLKISDTCHILTKTIQQLMSLKGTE